MKIAITSHGNSLDANIDARFGRAIGYIIWDTETKTFSYVDNMQVLNAPQGAGVQAAKSVVDTGAKIVITGHVGPNAFRALNAAGIKMFLKTNGTVKDAIDDYTNGNLKETGNSNVEGHWV
ncbi:MAG: NifB/NifX family molybdenum-iron cluster-binding protein [Candidatus Muirbacterium halophilum]|nr:NifB/NifX family molybdenum-iron cluster-binding protein [Candidatus Muirbacterium halophilum]MCK9476015.1 NifB/NifX family molybdenum-iron cluster-binding protein [Candidatus Muirbacterium halophilum]